MIHSSAEHERVELGYCQRCGALRAGPPGAECPACQRVLRWLLGPRWADRRPSRPKEAPDASAHA